MDLRNDCRHFPGDRPCQFHKQQGFLCGDCPHYATRGEKILMIKLEALGDVLRTTSILPTLKRKYPRAFVTWITLTPAIPLLWGNPLVDEVIDAAGDALPRLLIEEYDLAINPDTARSSAAWLTLARAKKKLGFGLDPRGVVFPYNPEAEPWLEMGAFDPRKKANRQTYPEIILRLCQLQVQIDPPAVYLSGEEKSFAENFARHHDLLGSGKTVGLYTGAGNRWENKRWTQAGYQDLIRRLVRETDFSVLIYGGPDAEERNLGLSLAFETEKRVVNAGSRHNLRKFLALLNLSDLVVTADTLALHAALALGKKVIGLFGPTSAAEIELYSRGVKLTGDLDCLGCYLQTCSRHPTCMESITPDQVWEALMSLLPPHSQS